MPTPDSGHRGLILEIEGCPTALTSYPGLPVSWGTASVRICSVPTSPTLGVDPRTWEADAGGTSIHVTQIDDLLNQYRTDPTALLTAGADVDDTTINVDDTTDFDASGVIWIGRNAIFYTGKTATTFTGCLWGIYGTKKRDAIIGGVVYGFQPEIIDAQVWLYWYDPATATKTLRFTGYIDDVDLEEEGTLITLLSAKKKLIEQRAFGAPFAEGYLLEDVETLTPQAILLHSLDPANPITNDNGLLDRLHVRIGDEIIKYELLLNPRLSANIDLVPGAGQVRTDLLGASLKVSELVDIVDGASNIDDTIQITKIQEISTNVWQIDYTSSTGYTPSVGDDLVPNYSPWLNALRMERGAAGTQPATHKAGANVREVRVLEGDQLEDILFPLLFSVEGSGTEGPESGRYDILPPGWGLGLDASLVDIDAFKDALQGRSDYRRYRREEPLEIEELLRWIAVSTNSIIFWDITGRLTCIARTDIYPGMTFRTNLKIERTRIPGLRVAGSHIINSVTWSTDFSLDGTPQRVIVVEDRESTDIRDTHRGEDMEDPGVLAHKARGQLYTVHRGLLLLRSRPVPIIELDVLFDEATPYQLGEVVLVDIAAFPNLKGGQDLLDTFEIIDVGQADPQGMCSLVLMWRSALARVGLISIWSEVQSWLMTDVVLKPQASTYAAPPGTEDVELWREGDPIEFWDASSFGSGSVNRFATTIDSIDVPSRTLSVAAVPMVVPDGWMLAQDDLVRLNDHTTVKAGATASERIDVYIALATGSPLALGADKPMQWGV